MSQQGASSQGPTPPPQHWVRTLKRLANGDLRIRLQDLDAFVSGTESCIEEFDVFYQNAWDREQYWDLYIRYNRWRSSAILQRDCTAMQQEYENMMRLFEQLQESHTANCARFCNHTVAMYEPYRHNVLVGALATLRKVNGGFTTSTSGTGPQAPYRAQRLQENPVAVNEYRGNEASGSRDEQAMEEDVIEEPAHPQQHQQQEQEQERLQQRYHQDVLELGELMATLSLNDDSEDRGASMSQEEDLITEQTVKMEEVLGMMKSKRQSTLVLRCKMVYHIQSVGQMRQKIVQRYSERRRISDWEGKFIFGL